MAAAATARACRLWKRELQSLANETDIEIVVRHLPRGTSKWNKIEHRLFSYISQNWRARPLVSYRVIVHLIAGTTTETGLTVRCELDRNRYPKGISASKREMAAINITRHDFHGEWNYTIASTRRKIERLIRNEPLATAFQISHRIYFRTDLILYWNLISRAALRGRYYFYYI